MSVLDHNSAGLARSNDEYTGGPWQILTLQKALYHCEISQILDT